MVFKMEGRYVYRLKESLERPSYEEAFKTILQKGDKNTLEELCSAAKVSIKLLKSILPEKHPAYINIRYPFNKSCLRDKTFVDGLKILCDKGIKEVSTTFNKDKASYENAVFNEALGQIFSTAVEVDLKSSIIDSVEVSNLRKNISKGYDLKIMSADEFSELGFLPSAGQIYGSAADLAYLYLFRNSKDDYFIENNKNIFEEFAKKAINAATLSIETFSESQVNNDLFILSQEKNIIKTLSFLSRKMIDPSKEYHSQWLDKEIDVYDLINSIMQDKSKDRDLLESKALHSCLKYGIRGAIQASKFNYKHHDQGLDILRTWEFFVSAYKNKMRKCNSVEVGNYFVFLGDLERYKSGNLISPQALEAYEGFRDVYRNSPLKVRNHLKGQYQKVQRQLRKKRTSDFQKI